MLFNEYKHNSPFSEYRASTDPRFLMNPAVSRNRCTNGAPRSNVDNASDQHVFIIGGNLSDAPQTPWSSDVMLPHGGGLWRRRLSGSRQNRGLRSGGFPQRSAHQRRGRYLVRAKSSYAYTQRMRIILTSPIVPELRGRHDENSSEEAKGSPDDEQARWTLGSLVDARKASKC